MELHIPSLPQLPPHLHTTKNLPTNLLPALLQAFQMSSSSFSEILNSLKLDLLVNDFLQPCAPRMASSRGIPSVLYSTTSVAPFSFGHHLYTHGSSSSFPYQGINTLGHEKVDRRELCAPADLKVEDGANEQDDYAFGNFKLSCDVVLIRSSKWFEGKYIDYLSELCHKKVVPTGALIDQEFHNNNGDNEERSEMILNWLSKKALFSTVFICFGSEYILSREQILEITKGLEISSQANFIWAIRFVDGDGNTLRMEDVFPVGFLDRVKERGLVLQGWAPQAKILAHPSVGGFMSHCGWNSIIESMYFGVPIIAMPMKYEQPISARLLVETGVGVEVGRGENGNFRGDEVAKAIDKVIVEKDSGEGLRSRAGKLSEKMKEEAEQAVDEAAEELLRLCKKSKQYG